MKILLIQPNKSEVKPPMPPLGLAYIGAVAEAKGCKVKIVDLAAPHTLYSLENLLEIARSFDIIGIYLATYFVFNSYKLIHKLKEMGKTVIVGGPHATLRPKEAIDFGKADVVVRREGEETIAELIDYFHGKVKLTDILGITYKNEKIISNPDRPFIEDLDTLPFPAKHLFVKSDYIRSDKQTNSYGNVLLSRGCPGRCTYCSARAITGKSYRTRSYENVLAEIEHLIREFGVHHISFRDDTFTGNKKRVEDFCNKILARKDLNFTWHCITRPDSVTEELLMKMKHARCTSICYGIESANNYTLKRIQKNHTIEKVVQIIAWTKNAGIPTTTNFISGFPWEGEADIKNNTQFIKKLAKDVSIAPGSILVPFPETPIYQEFKKSHGFTDWWLKTKKFNAIYRKQKFYPFYRRYFFQDDGQFVEKDGWFFNHHKDIKKMIIRLAMEIGKVNIAQLVGITENYGSLKQRISKSLLVGFAYLSLVLCRISHRVERIVFNLIFDVPFRLRKTL